jgi:hypothetical protein
MAQGRSTEIITMMKWIRTSRLSIKNSLSLKEETGGTLWRNVAHTRQSSPDPGLDFEVKILKTFRVVAFSLKSGLGLNEEASGDGRRQAPLGEFLD